MIPFSELPWCQGSYDQLLLDKYVRGGRPLTIHFELTHRCNLKCVHCLYEGFDSDELGTDDVLDVLLNLKRAGVMYLALSGGELFVRKDMDRILDFLIEHRFVLTIYTNGTLLSPKKVDQISKLNPESTEISIYGANPTTHDSITRVDGSFQKSIRGIADLRDAGVRTIFKGFLLKENFAERKEMVALGDRLNVPYSFDFNLIPRFIGPPDNLDHALTVEQLKTVYKEVAEEGAVLRNNVTIISRESQLPKGGNVICNPGVINGCVGPDGELYPCPLLRISLGNLKSASLEALWKTRAIDALRSMRKEDLRECMNCDIVEHCNRCPGVAFIETGDYLGPAPLSVCGKYRALANDRDGGDTKL